MKQLLPLLILMFAATAFGQVTSKYDKFDDLTFVKARPIELQQGGEYKILFKEVTLKASFAHKGSSLPSDVDAFYLMFVVKSSDWLYLSSIRRKMVILADDKRIADVDEHHSGNVSSSGRDISTTERLAFTVNRANLQAIIVAKKVEVQVGLLETTFTESDKAILAELLKAGTK